MDFLYIISTLIMARLIKYYSSLDEEALPNFGFDIIIQVLHIIVFCFITYGLITSDLIIVRFIAVYTSFKVINCAAILMNDISYILTPEDDETDDNNEEEL